MSPNLEAPTTVNVPSADLINYRFDQSDKKFEEMNRKLDTILTQNSNFVSESQVERMISDHTSSIQETLNTYRWYIRSLFGAFILVLLTYIFEVVSKGVFK